MRQTGTLIVIILIYCGIFNILERKQNIWKSIYMPKIDYVKHFLMFSSIQKLEL